MNRIKKTSIAILCFLLVLSLVTSCNNASNNDGTKESPTTAEPISTSDQIETKDSIDENQWPKDPNLNSPGTLPICKETVALSVGIAQNAMVEDWETNLMTLELEERGNFDLTFEEYPSDEIQQKFELMIMAGGKDLPDIIMHGLGGMANLTKFGESGMLIATNEYYEHLTHWIDLSLQNVEIDVLKYVTSHDGNIYGMYNYMESLNNQYSVARIMIYEPWLENLDLDMPETTEEFADVLRAFRDNDPNQNNQADEIPLLGNKDVMTTNYAYAMMTPFIYTQENYWTNENGKIDVAFNKEEWREGLRYTKQLIDEDLLSPLSFTQDRAQMTTMVSPDPAVVGAFPMVSASFLGAEDLKRADYIIVPPLEGPTGRKEQVWSPSLPGIGMVITKNCKTPEAAFMLGDLMCSEEFSVWSRWGRKGIEWNEATPDQKSVYEPLGYEAIIEPIAPWGGMQNVWWAQCGPYIVDARYPAGQVASGSPYDHNAPIGRSIAPQVEMKNPNPIVGLVYNNEEQEIITEHHTTILTYVRESFTRFAMGDLDLDKDWDSYLAEFEKMELNDVIGAAQSAYDRMNK